MFDDLLRKLDDWLEIENDAKMKEGERPFPQSEIRALGQTALIEAKLDLALTATLDLDAYLVMDYFVRKKLEQLLEARGYRLDPDSNLVWMPPETKYNLYYDGRNVRAFLAKPEYVIVSKALKAPEKNLELIRSYLARFATQELLDLCARHGVQLEKFL